MAECLSQLQKVRGQLERSDAGETLVTFLLEVADGKATLADVTEEIRSWLVAQGALALLAVRFR